MSKKQTERDVLALVVRLHHARLDVERLRREMAACQCQHELAGEFLHGFDTPYRDALALDRDGTPYAWRDPETGEVLLDWQPCWKGRWSNEEGVGYITLGEGERGTCDPCARREKMRQPYSEAKRHLGATKSALTRAAKRLAESMP